MDWFWPGYKAGGPIQSCVNICKALHNSFDIYVLTTDTDHGESSPYPNILQDQWTNNTALGAKIYYAQKKNLSLAHLKKVILEAEVDIVYLNHLFSPKFVVYPLWLKFKGIIKSKLVVCPRGALYQSALSLKAYKKIPLLKLYRWSGLYKKILFHATNQREKEAIDKYFPGSNVVIADNLPNIQQEEFVSVEKRTGELKCISHGLFL